MNSFASPVRREGTQIRSTTLREEQSGKKFSLDLATHPFFIDGVGRICAAVVFCHIGRIGPVASGIEGAFCGDRFMQHGC